MSSRPTEIKPRELPALLISAGEEFVSTQRVADLLGVPSGQVSRRLEPARRDRRIVSVTKGAWVPVEEGWSHLGAPPPDEYLDRLMAHLGHRYYVAYRSAAAAYGVSHHSLPVYQVAVDSYCRDRTIGAARLRFVRSARVGRVPVRRRPCGPSASLTVATPEATAFDLVERPLLGGGLDYVATILGDMQAVGLLDADELAAVSALYPRAVVQRAGHLLDHMSRELSTTFPLDALRKALDGRDTRTVTLSCGVGAAPTRPAAGAAVDRRWKVLVDYEIEHDL